MADDSQYGMIRDRHESLVARLSPAARHAAFPSKYARPLPVPTDADKLNSKIVKLTVETTHLRSAISELEEENKRLVGMLSRLQNISVLPINNDSRVGILEVMGAFCTALKAEGYEVDDGPITIEHLRNAKRSREYAMPRQVAMWLCRRICTHASSTMIGKAFGGRDHTTALHALERAPKLVAGNSAMKSTASRVLAHFGAIL